MGKSKDRPAIAAGTGNDVGLDCRAIEDWRRWFEPAAERDEEVMAENHWKSCGSKRIVCCEPGLNSELTVVTRKDMTPPEHFEVMDGYSCFRLLSRESLEEGGRQDFASSEGSGTSLIAEPGDVCLR